MDDVGIVIASIGSMAPSGLTGGNPGLAENTLTVAASGSAVYKRIVMDMFFLGDGGGLLVHPLENRLLANFSSHRFLGDRRCDPQVLAPGKWRFVQHADGTAASWVSGTSFSAPTVAGVAAVLFSIQLSTTPPGFRGTILPGVNSYAIQGSPTVAQKQGYGLVDAYGDYLKLLTRASNPIDDGPQGYQVACNIFFKYSSANDYAKPIYGSYSGSGTR